MMKVLLMKKTNDDLLKAKANLKDSTVELRKQFKALWLYCLGGIKYFVVGVFIMLVGLSTMWWGAYSSCRDGGGVVRGFSPYLQCVGYKSGCDVPFLDGISMEGCSNICLLNGGHVVINKPLFKYNVSFSNVSCNVSRLDQWC